MDLRALTTRIAALPRYYVRGLAGELYERQVFLWAQAIAFKVLITVVPVIVLGTGLAASILRLERPFSSVETLIRDFLPAYQSDQIVVFLSQLQSASGTLTFSFDEALVEVLVVLKQIVFSDEVVVLLSEDPQSLIDIVDVHCD